MTFHGNDEPAAPAVLTPEIQQAVWFLGALVRVRASGAATAGALDVLEHRGERGYASPVHRHLAEDETFFLLDGELRVEVGGDAHIAGPGAVASPASSRSLSLPRPVLARLPIANRANGSTVQRTTAFSARLSIRHATSQEFASMFRNSISMRGNNNGRSPSVTSRCGGSDSTTRISTDRVPRSGIATVSTYCFPVDAMDTSSCAANDSERAELAIRPGAWLTSSAVAVALTIGG